MRKDQIKSAIASATGNQKAHVLDLKLDAAGELVPDVVQGLPGACQGTAALVVRLANQVRSAASPLSPDTWSLKLNPEPQTVCFAP